MSPPLPPLLFLTDGDRTPEPWRTAAALPPGSAVIYRSLGEVEAEATARRLRMVTADQGVRLLIGLDADLAETVGADGVHLPERRIGEAAALRARRPDWLLTAAAHGPRDPVSLIDLDAVVVSPVFPAGGASATKPPLGVKGFAALCDSLGRPAYALGGVDATTARALAHSGACGLAAVGAIQNAFGRD